MCDKHFTRAVVLICEKNEKGALGYILNKKTDLSLQEVLREEIAVDYPLYMGGPMQQNTLHYLHSIPSLSKESTEIGEGLYWGHNFDSLTEILRTKPPTHKDIKFFAGYSGWESIQLEEEVISHCWMTQSRYQREHIFSSTVEELWSEVLRTMGKPYVHFANFPKDPTLN